MDIYTLGGGPCEARASLLANKGFAVLALAYYGYEDLPRTVPKKFDLEYFEAAVAFLAGHPLVSAVHTMTSFLTAIFQSYDLYSYFYFV